MYYFKLFILSLVAFIPTLTYAQSFSYYYGNIHAHSAFSDGNQDSDSSLLSTPLQDYQYGETAECFDFMGISDHNHAGAGMSKPNYAIGMSQAAMMNADGAFVTMYGTEWGVISSGGHVLVYGMNQLIGWETNNYDIYNAKTDYDGVFAKVAATPNAFVTLAHPNTSDYNDLLTIHVYSATIDSALVGVAVRNGPSTSSDTTYTDPSNYSYEYQYQLALAKGYHVAPMVDHDNHNSTFGRTTRGRTIIMANSLTRAQIIDAFRKRRFYASDDCNASIDFQVSQFTMGSQCTKIGNPLITLSMNDPDGETISKIVLKYGIPGSEVVASTLITLNNQQTLSYTHNIPNLSTYYYYCVVTQADGNVIYTAPIWYKRNDAFLPADLSAFTAKYFDSSIKINWETASEKNVKQFEIQRSSNGIDFETIQTVKGAGNSNELIAYERFDNQPLKGTSYYRLNTIDWDSNNRYSNIISLTLPDIETVVNVAPNPVVDFATFSFSGLIPNSSYQLEIANAIGQKVRSYEVSSENEIIFLRDNLAKGIYFYELNDGINIIYNGKLILN